MAQALDDFFASRDWPALQEIAGWRVERDAKDTERVVLTVPARDGELYRILLLCDGYDGVAPSVAFINEHGSKSDARAWPRGDAEFFKEVKPPPSSFICMPLTREGLQHHTDWIKSEVGAWKPGVHTLMDLFNRLKRLLNSDHYLGRGA